MDIPNDSYICKDDSGNVLISVVDTDETLLSKNSLLTHCLAVVKIGTDYLLGWNNWRKRYEIFGGCIEKGESARECIVRECYEELGIQGVDLAYLGAMKFLMKPNYFSSNERIEYGGLFGITLPNMSLNDIFMQINDREEISKLALYSQIKDIEPIAVIDEKLLEYYV